MFRGFKEWFFLEKVNTESRKPQGPFKGPCKAQWKTMTGHGPCWGQLLCPLSPLIWFFTFRVQKYGLYSRFSPVGHLPDIYELLFGSQIIFSRRQIVTKFCAQHSTSCPVEIEITIKLSKPTSHRTTHQHTKPIINSPPGHIPLTYPSKLKFCMQHKFTMIRWP